MPTEMPKATTMELNEGLTVTSMLLEIMGRMRFAAMDTI